MNTGISDQERREITQLVNKAANLILQVSNNPDITSEQKFEVADLIDQMIVDLMESLTSGESTRGQEFRAKVISKSQRFADLHKLKQ